MPLPPSTNALYIMRRGGGKALSKEAKTFQVTVKDIISRQLGSIVRFPVDEEDVYGLDVLLFFDSLENPGWFVRWDKDTYVSRGKKKGELKGRAGERKAKTRYKVIDYDNRIKFLQDCVTEGVGIPNDSQVFRGLGEKREDSEDPRAEVRIRVLSRDDFFTERR